MKSTTIASSVRFRAKRAPRAILFVALCLTCRPAFGTGPAAFLPLPPETNSTVPANGDVDPFGIAFVPNNYSGGGVLEAGDILVSNFNNNLNLQGTGHTIVRVTPDGQGSTFFTGGPNVPVGFTSTIAVLRTGFVIVGTLPTTDGTSATIQPGSLLVLDSAGQPTMDISDPLIESPWGLAVRDQGNQVTLFVANVLSGTIVRIGLVVSPGNVSVVSKTQIASGYLHRTDPAALVLGPAGLAFDPNRNALYVASTEDNAVFRVDHASNLSADQGTGTMIYQDDVHLHAPVSIAIAPNGHLLAGNGDVSHADPNQPSEIVEFTIQGSFVRQLSVDPNLGGLFGMAVATTGNVARLAAVDDNRDTLTVWTLPSH